MTGGKTGYTKKAKRTLVTSAKKEDMELICVTFNCGDDWNVHQKLFDYGFNNYEMKTIVRRQIIDLEGKLGTVTSERDELAPYKKQFEELSGEVTRLGKIVSDYKALEEKKAQQDRKDEILKGIIYQKLLVESASLDDLLSVIQSNGITTDMNEVSRLLREMRKNINIT